MESGRIFLRGAVIAALVLAIASGCGAMPEGWKASRRKPGAPGGAAYTLMKPSGHTLDSILGISTHLSKSPEYSEPRSFELAKLSEAGIGMARTDFTWSRIEPEDDQWRPEGYDLLVDLARDSGIEVLAIIDFGVDWAMPGGSHNEIDPAAFGDYAGYIARHFGDRIDHYEVWNEPDIVRFWKPWPNPEHYGRLLEAASKAVRENDPGAIVLFGGMSNAEEHIIGPRGLWRFFRQVRDHHPEVCEWFDAMAIHTYTWLQQSSPELGSDDDALLWYDLTGAINHARDVLDRAGCRDKEIWVTETGWPHTLIGEDRQAAYLVRNLVLSMAAAVDRWMVYTFWDGPNSATFTEHAFGLYARHGDNPRPKPAYHAVRTAHDILGNMRYAGDLGRELGWHNGCRALVFGSDDGSSAVVVWKETSSRFDKVVLSVPLPAPRTGWELIDQFGNAVGAGVDGSVDVKAGMEAVYLIFQ